MENFEELRQAYDKYILILKKFFPESVDAIDAMETDLGERLFLAPRDTTPDLGGIPGGLVSFSLDVARQTKIFREAVNHRSLVRVALLHEVGRLGGPLVTQDLFLTETSDWHREKLNRNYKYNEACPKMSTSHRTLFYIAKYGFKVSMEEWVAILTSAGFQYDENRFYANENLPLASALQMCRTLTFNELKQK